MKKYKNTSNILIIVFAVFILFHLIMFPKEMLQASANGLLLWFNVVLPSIFPFLVTVSILSATNITDTLETALSPVMKPIFKVSGSSAFPFILGVLSGYPLGAKIVCDMEKSKKITSTEAQRLMAFVNNPSPLFVIGTVATGMFNNSYIGYVLLLSTFLGSILTGLLFRFYKPNHLPTNILIRKKNKLPTLGNLLNASVNSSVLTITTIGGFIIFFSVVTKALELSGVFNICSSFLSDILGNKVPTQFFNSIFAGLLEMTGGLKTLSLIEMPSTLVIPTAAFLLSFGGFSIIAQTISIISESSIKISTYIFSKLINAIFSFLICKILITLTKPLPYGVVTVFSHVESSFGLFFEYSLIVSLIIFIFITTFSLLHKIFAKQKAQ